MKRNRRGIMVLASFFLLVFALSPFSAFGEEANESSAEEPAQEATPELDEAHWSGSAEASLSGNSGNTEDTSIEATSGLAYHFGSIHNAKGELKSSTYLNGKYTYKKVYRWEESEGTDGATKKTKVGETTENRFEANTGATWYFVQRGCFIGNVGFEKDKFKHIDARYNLELGAGYNLVDRARHDVYIEGGGLYTSTEFEETDDSGNGDSHEDGAGYFGGAKYELSWSPVVFSLSGEYKRNLDLKDDYRAEGEAKMEVHFTERWKVFGSYTADYENKPVDVNTERLDTTFKAGIGVSF